MRTVAGPGGPEGLAFAHRRRAGARGARALWAVAGGGRFAGRAGGARRGGGRQVAQGLGLGGVQGAEGAAGQVAEAQGAEGHARQFEGGVADGLAEAADVVVLPLGHDHFHEGVLLQDAEHLRPQGAQGLAAGTDARGQPGHGFGGRDSLDLGMVHLRDTVAGVAETQGQVAIVGEEEQAFGPVVEAAHRVEARQAGRGSAPPAAARGSPAAPGPCACRPR